MVVPRFKASGTFVLCATLKRPQRRSEEIPTSAAVPCAVGITGKTLQSTPAELVAATLDRLTAAILSTARAGSIDACCPTE